MFACPMCGGKFFKTLVDITQEWVVDEDGVCMKVTDECRDVLTSANNYDLMTCIKCGFEDDSDVFEAE